MRRREPKRIFRKLLVGVVIVECVAGAALAVRQWLTPRPPLPLVVLGEPTAASDLREQADNCETAADWSQLGENYLAYGYLAEAEACFGRAMTLEPLIAGHAFDRAFVVERLGRLEDANRYYARAIELQHDDPAVCWYSVGRNHLRLNARDKARQAFEQAPSLPAAQFELARLLADSGQTEQATALLDAVRAAHPRAIQPAVLRYQWALLAGDFKVLPGLAEAARFAYEPMPTPFDDQYARLKSAFQRLGAAKRWEAAREQFVDGDIEAATNSLESVHESEWSPVAGDLKSEIEIASGLPERAIFTRKQIVARDGPSMLALGRLGDAYEQMGRRDEAVEVWKRAVALQAGPQIKDIYDRLARDARRRPDADSAARYESLAHFHAGVGLFWSGDWQRSEKAFRDALELDPQLADAHYYLGAVLLRKGEHDQARTALEECLKLNPDHGRAAEALERCNTK